jgi:hypothetical protein
MDNRTNKKRQLPFVFCKLKTEMANFRLFAANGKHMFYAENGNQTFVFLVQQTTNGNRRLLFQQMCPSMLIGTEYLVVSITKLE